MMPGFANVGRKWNLAEFGAYLETLQRPGWVDAVCLHHTGAPSLAQRPKGLREDSEVHHIRNIRDFYIREHGWSAGPHLFIDDTDGRCVLGMTPLHLRGVHASSFNRRALGVEVLGNYDDESPVMARGLHAWRNAAAVTRMLLAWLKLKPNEKTVLFHREDPRTEKSCPGDLVSKPWVLALVREG